MEVDKLLIVAHPDDEVLWGGLNLMSQSGWFVVCSTNINDPVRSREFFKTMSYAAATKFVMFDVEDTYVEEDYEADDLYDGSVFDKALQQLAKKDWKVVLTHNEVGEYGHAHHRKVHRMVKALFPQAKFFADGHNPTAGDLNEKKELLQFYQKTQDVCRKIYNGQGSKLRKLEREHFFHEKLYVKPSKSIPFLIHQIWFGTPLAKTTIRYNLMNGVKKMAENHGFQYKLWTNDDLTRENFPLVWDYMQTAIETGEDLGQSRFAQVADLARYEILHRFGGVYMDSLFEIGEEFCKYIKKNDKFEMIVANEDPCGLKCESEQGKYISNGFFACIPGCIVLTRLLHTSTLESIDFDSVYINRTTGPYFFRKGMKPRDKIHVIDTAKIYPFMVNDSEYRKGTPNQCITGDEKLLHNCLTEKYSGSLAVYHSGFGGSWSW
jgi:phage regulator Rha-like protein